MIVVFFFNLLFHEIVTAVTHVLGLCVTFIQFTIPFLPIIFLLLLLYSFGLLIINYIKTYLYKKSLQISYLLSLDIYDLSLKHNLRDRIVLFEDSQPKAFCLGILHPKIYLSTALVSIMDTKELEVIFLHEKYHLIQNDNLFLFVFSFVNNFLLLFPFMNDLFKKYLEKLEVDADRSAVNYLNDSSVLISSFKKLLNYRSLEFPSISYISSYSNYPTIEIRIRAAIDNNVSYTNFEKNNLIISFISLLILIVAIFYPIKITHAHNDVHQPVMCLEKQNTKVNTTNNYLIK